MKNIALSLVLLMGGLVSSLVYSHSKQAASTYLGNEGVLVTVGKEKILFDPFFHNSYNHYTLVPEKLRKAIFAGEAPFDGVTAIFVSHAHGDHFDANDVSRYLQKFKTVRLVAPQQAVNQLKLLKSHELIANQITAIELSLTSKPWSEEFSGVKVEAVRIPHAGWPARKEVENLLYRVSLGVEYTVMHLGDADTNKQFYQPHSHFFASKRSNLAFVPYWFYGSLASQQVIKDFLNVDKTIGVHVPTNVPEPLKAQKQFDYFSKPGEMRSLRRD